MHILNSCVMCSLARFDLANRGVRQPIQPHTYARLLVFDETLAPASFCSSIARWLSPKPAKSRHEKLLDPAKNKVTNFQLKPAKNSEILLKN